MDRLLSPRWSRRFNHAVEFSAGDAGQKVFRGPGGRLLLRCQTVIENSPVDGGPVFTDRKNRIAPRQSEPCSGASR